MNPKMFKLVEMQNIQASSTESQLEKVNFT